MRVKKGTNIEQMNDTVLDNQQNHILEGNLVEMLQVGGRIETVLIFCIPLEN